MCAVDQKRSFFPRAVPFLDFLPFQGPFPLTGALTGRPPYGKAPYGEASYKKAPYELQEAYGKLRGETLPELGGNFRLCAVDQKRSFFSRAVLFLDLLPFQGPFPLTGALTGKPPYGKAPYGEASYEKAPYELQESLRGRTLPELGGNFRLCAVDQKRSFFPRVVPFLDLLPFKGPFPLTGALTGRPPALGRALSRLQGPLRADRLTGRPLTGRLLTRRPLTNYRKAYGKLRGETLPELGGNFRLCAVDQKRSFFPRVMPFLDFPPFKGPFPLTGALTGRQPYGQAPYGEASYGKAPLGDFLRETPLITGKLTGRLGPYGKPLTRRDGPYGKGRSLASPYGNSGNPKSKTQNPKSKTQNPKSKTQNPKSKTQKVFFPFALGKPARIQNPKSKTQNPKPKTQNLKSKTQNPKPKILGRRGLTLKPKV